MLPVRTRTTSGIPLRNPGELIPGIPTNAVVEVIGALEQISEIVPGFDLPPEIDATTPVPATKVSDMLTIHAEGGGGPFTNEEIKPYREAIVDSIAYTRNRGTRGLAKWRVNKIGADTLNTQLNAPATQSGIRVGLGILATIMSYETPRAQFESELIQAAKHARAVAREHRADIIGRAETAAELDRQVTAEDAAIGFISLADTILYDRPRLQQEDGRPELPMLRALVRTLLTETGLKIRLDLSSKQALIEAAAPEIVDAFDEVLPKTQHNKAFAASVRKHETTSTIKHVPGRTGAELTSAVDLFGFKHKNPLRVVQDAIPQLLNGLRKLMPDHRSELADTREWIERVLLQNPQ